MVSLQQSYISVVFEEPPDVQITSGDFDQLSFQKLFPAYLFRRPVMLYFDPLE